MNYHHSKSKPEIALSIVIRMVLSVPLALLFTDGRTFFEAYTLMFFIVMVWHVILLVLTSLRG